MIYTVFCTSAAEEMQWRSELLEYSWGRVRQPGELVRLVASRPGDATPRHRLARVVETLCWSPHPYTGDAYLPYIKPASLLEWLFTQRIDGTILLVEPHCIFRSRVASEAGRGEATAMSWSSLPRGDGPFGLRPGFEFLERFCVDRTLPLAAVTLPLRIHSTDLARIAARWLELTGIIRAETQGQPDGPLNDADALAYTIAAAEAGVQHSEGPLSIGTDVAASAAPILDYRRPVCSADGPIAWSLGTYRIGDRAAPERAPPGTGREFLALLDEFVTRRSQGAELAFVRPCRRKGVREGRILGRVFLEVPGRSDTVSLNDSGAAIWGLCDGKRSLADVNRDLEARYGMPPGSIRADVAAAIDRLAGIGALELEPV